MKDEIFCRACGTSISAKDCAFTYKREVGGREVYFCCPHCMEEYKEEK
jgi:YHS domain-containing protein